MRFYTNQHKYYCGIDLHANKMYLCVVDSAGEVKLHKNITTNPGVFLRFIAPFREDVVVGVESVFCWYWLCDVCRREDIPFVLGHALYMKAIHGAKAKNDKIDSNKLAVMLRGGVFPMSFSYPKEMRATRDLMRRRLFFVNKRAELVRHIQMTHQQYNLPTPSQNLKYHSNLEKYENPFEDESARRMIEGDLFLIKQYTTEIDKLNWFLEKTAKEDEKFSFEKTLLETVPGIGPVLSLTMLYEIFDINRFPSVQHFSSYARLVKPEKTSSGKKAGSGGGKIGNRHLKWAFGEATALFLRQSEEAKKYLTRLEKRYGNKAKAMSVLSHKLGKAVYFILHRKEGFSQNKIFQ